jgi:hypothetical protein
VMWRPRLFIHSNQTPHDSARPARPKTSEHPVATCNRATWVRAHGSLAYVMPIARIAIYPIQSRLQSIAASLSQPQYTIPEHINESSHCIRKRCSPQGRPHP